MSRDAALDQSQALVPEDDQAQQQPKADRRRDQEVHGADPGRMM
jgi:hypothetical protein